MSASPKLTNQSVTIETDALPPLTKSPSGARSVPQHASGPSRLERWTREIFCHFRRHAGIGIVTAVGYFDPGNWSVDLEAGSEYGYKLLAVVLLAGIMAIVLQSMSERLGCVTGLDLAAHCRLLLYNRTKRPRLFRWLVLYPLYALAEVAIISTDLAELLGSATAISLLFPALPLWAGVLITSLDVLIILAFCSPVRDVKRPQRVFEFIITVLVLAVFLCMVLVIVQVKPDWRDAFYGYIPSKTIFAPGALYTSIGIIGATVMPHSLFIGSSLATHDRVSPYPDTSHESDGDQLPTSSSAKRRHESGSFPLKLNKRWLHSAFRSWRVDNSNGSDLPNETEGHAGWQNNSNSFIRAHLTHGIVDVVLSLLGIAVVINSLILIMASAVFHYGQNGEDTSIADLFEAYGLIRANIGKGVAILFALALLCAGESSGITATVAGQIVCEGFLRWHVSPVIRRTLTRLIALVPAMLVASIMGRSGLGALLVASQVVLSFVLPFVAFPLVWLTSNSKIMSVRRVPSERNLNGDPENATLSGDEIMDYSNGRIVTVIGYAIWLVVLVANVYVLVTLATGEGDCELSIFIGHFGRKLMLAARMMQFLRFRLLCSG